MAVPESIPVDTAESEDSTSCHEDDMTSQSPAAETYSRDTSDLICNLGTRPTEAQIYTYLKDHVQPPAKMLSKNIFKGGKAVNLTSQASWMSGNRAFRHVYSLKLNGELC